MKENNELIAEFLGWIRHNANSSYNLPQWYKPDEKDLRKRGIFKGYPEQLKFHQSWDWIMPVVEKIEEIALNVVIETGCVTIDVMDDAFPEYHSTITYEWQEDTKLNVLYRAVIEFITWYNTTKQPQPERESDRSNEPSSEL